MPNLHWNKGKDAKQNPTPGTVVHITQGSQKRKNWLDKYICYLLYRIALCSLSSLPMADSQQKGSPIDI